MSHHPAKTSSSWATACLLILLVSVVGLLGCTKSEKSQAASGSATEGVKDGVKQGGQTDSSDTPAEQRDPAASPQTPARPLPIPRMEESEMVEAVLTALSDWTRAQSAGDATAYFAFYAESSFRGVRRTASGTEKSFDFAGWREDRAPMLAKKPIVVAAFPQVLTWHVSEATLEPGFVETRFIQRFKLGKYADHGPKVLRWRWHGEGAGWKIDHEDMVSSQPGFSAKDDAPPVTKLDLREMIPPLDGTVRLITPADDQEQDEEPKPMILLTFMDAKGVERTLHLWTDSAGCGVEEKPDDGIFGVACFWAGAGLGYEMKRKKDVLVITLVLEDEELENALRHPYAEVALPNKTKLAFKEERVTAGSSR